VSAPAALGVRLSPQDTSRLIAAIKDKKFNGLYIHWGWRMRPGQGVVNTMQKALATVSLFQTGNGRRLGRQLSRSQGTALLWAAVFRMQHQGRAYGPCRQLRPADQRGAIFGGFPLVDLEAHNLAAVQVEDHGNRRRSPGSRVPRRRRRTRRRATGRKGSGRRVPTPPDSSVAASTRGWSDSCPIGKNRSAC